MRAAARALVVVLALAISGCALPTWMPFAGKKKETPAPPAAPARVVTPGSEILPAPVIGEMVTKPSDADGDETVADRIVAVVNNDAITMAELQESIAVFRNERREQSAVTDAELGRQFLSRLIDSRLQLQEADRDRIAVDESEVNDEVNDRMKRFGTKNLEEFEALVKQQGLTMDAVKKRLRDSLRVAKVIRRRVTLRVSVTDPEIAQYIEENRSKLETGLSYRARHILVVPEADTDAGWEAARIRLEVIRGQIADGGDFADLARRNSRDASAKDGGDLGNLHPGELSKEIEDQILRLRPGQVSQPYRSPLGYHLFRLESKETLEGEAMERVRTQVREILFREKYEGRMAEWIKEIKQRAIIEVRM